MIIENSYSLTSVVYEEFYEALGYDAEAVGPVFGVIVTTLQYPSSQEDILARLWVIVMSGHETIRVLEVGVDAQIPAEEEGKALEAVATEGSQSGGPAEAGEAAGEAGPDNPDSSVEATAPRPVLNPWNEGPFSVIYRPKLGRVRVLTQENLATVLTGVMVPAGAVTQPLLIPISIAGQVAGQQGLAVWTIPTATVAALPGLTAASPTGGIFKPPLAGLQEMGSFRGSCQPMHPSQEQTTSAKRAGPTFQNLDHGPALEGGMMSGDCKLISAASLGGQTQILGSLTTAPVIANAIPSMPGISSQILTNAQGQASGQSQVIGTLPWVVNSASVAAPAPAQSLQVQAVTPQLLLNAQGQVQPIQPTPAMPQPAVVIASPAPAAKPAASAPIPITCSETPTVSQLVSKPHTPSLDEDGINLEEIREFAKNFKIRRLSLGLTQTQVGQALTATEGPAYSQSAICRFEKLDITPKSAQKLKPVLEKWLHEAELRNQEGQQNLMEFVGGEPSKKRKRRTSFTPQAIEALNAYFEKNPLPTGQEITEIAKELNYDREVVRVWFCNRRQTLKNTSKLNVFQIP
ncbi:hypothetical protein MG293_003129 [Ovis ammon polii]|uniref:POU domain protein n=1 Tax=Ovis ammon polii TaxID=230172 RepID=A0AAD4UMM5_OVIAM|nr:hypothetical protein MG293_003129 [Ovis ammon polii]